MRVLWLVSLLAACSRPDPAQGSARIASLLPAWTETVTALGAGDRLVACSEYCEPGRELPRIDWRAPRSAEQLARLGPDLVLKQKPRAPHDPLREALKATGIRVVELPSETIADVRAAFEAIGKEVGRKEEARALRGEFDRGLAEGRQSVAGRSRPRVLFIYTRSPGVVANIGAAGPGSFIDEMISIAGGANVLAEAGEPYVQLDLERLVRLKPEVVIDNLPSEDDPEAVWRSVTLLDAKVRLVRDNRMLVPGPRLPEAARRLAAMIHGGP
ncbi:MAG: ABC transporter substrate-binding protein [Planctomycetota bacterium]